MLRLPTWNKKASIGTSALMAARFHIATLARKHATIKFMGLLITLLLLPLPTHAAIAVDTTVQASNTGAAGRIVCSKHTVTGSNTALVLGSYYYTNTGTDTWTATEYSNGGATSSMTQIGTVKSLDTNYKIRLHYVLGLTGVVTMCTTLSSNAGFNLFTLLSASYTGVSQTGFPDASNSGTAAGHADITGTVTTIANNSWLLMFTGTDDDASCTAGAGTTVRQNSSGATHANRACLVDSNAAKTPAGSYSVIVVPSVTSTLEGWIVVSFAPAGAATVPPPLWPFFFMSIGPIIPKKKLLAIIKSL